jgi:hypothetical protein
MNAYDDGIEGDRLSRAAFLAWQAARDPVERARRRDEYDAAEAEARRRWDIVGPDPLLSQLGKAQEVQDAAPNPDDPDDDR